jgi:hypothetical protein
MRSKATGILCFLLVMLIFSACTKVESSTKDPKQIESSKLNIVEETGENQSSLKLKDSTEANSSCKTAPKTLNWNDKEYVLKTENTSLEPVMKYGFLKCSNGKFIVGGDDDNNSYTVRGVGNPTNNKDIIIMGNWGRALYSPVKEEVTKEGKISSFEIREVHSIPDNIQDKIKSELSKEEGLTIYFFNDGKTYILLKAPSYRDTTGIDFDGIKIESNKIHIYFETFDYHTTKPGLKKFNLYEIDGEHPIEFMQTYSTEE